MTVMKRINVTLPEGTIHLLNRVAPKGDRSRVIDQAVRRYIETVGRKNLNRQLTAGARQRADRDLALAAEWFSLEEEAATSRGR